MQDILDIAVVQLTTPDTVEAGTTEVIAALDEAASTGAKMAFTPETTHLMTRGRENSLSRSCAENEDPGLKAICAAAKRHKMAVVIGSLIIKKSDDRLANRQFVIGADGAIKARYDKIHLFDIDLGSAEVHRESRLYDAGDTASVIQLDGLAAIGQSICFDLRFPALYQALVAGGAEILVVPAAFTRPTGAAHWHSLLRARAIETGCFVVAAAQTGTHANGRQTYGHSLVVDPWGGVLLDAGEAPGVYPVRLEASALKDARDTMPTLSMARDFKPPLE